MLSISRFLHALHFSTYSYVACGRQRINSEKKHVYCTIKKIDQNAFILKSFLQLLRAVRRRRGRPSREPRPEPADHAESPWQGPGGEAGQEQQEEERRIHPDGAQPEEGERESVKMM